MPKVKVNEINIYYEIVGEGEPLVLIMGLGTDHLGWMFQVPTLSEKYKLLLFDNRGVGLSDKPAGPYTIRMMADDTASLLEELKIEKAHILGISMGGMIAQELAINYPQKVGSLILAATYAAPDEKIREVMSNGLKYFVGVEKLDKIEEINFNNINMEKIMKFMMPLILSQEFINNNQELINQMIQQMLATEPSPQAFLAQAIATQNHNTLDRLNNITAPTLVLTGDKDILISPSHSEILAQKIPKAKLVKCEGGTHGFNLELKERFNKEVLNFLQENPLK